MNATPDIIGQLGALSYAGIWVTSFFANVVIPIPEEIILLALGYLVGTGKVNAFVIIPIVISGLLASDIIMYTLSKRGSRITTFLYKTFFAKRLAKRGDAWLAMHIEKIIFFSRFLVQLRFIGPFLAGQRKIKANMFIGYDLLALLLYVPLYIFLGWYFHTKVALIIADVGVVKNIVLAVAGLALAYGLFRFVYRLLFKSASR